MATNEGMPNEYQGRPATNGGGDAQRVPGENGLVWRPWGASH